MLEISLDRTGQEPLYQQIKEQVIRQIDGGHLSPGDRLPPTRELADQLGVARISVVTAYEELKASGYVDAQVGRGTFVRAPGDVLESGPPLAGMSPTYAALRDLLRLAARPGVIDFSRGTPAEKFLPVEVMRSALNTVLVRDGAAAIAYEEPEGYEPLRAAVAELVAAQGVSVTRDAVLITGGCQQALDLAVQALLNPGDVLLTSNPTYAGMLDITQARGVTPVGVPVDDDGMQVEVLDTLILDHRPRLLYVAPTYHNPTGTVMPLHRRRRLLEIAAQYRLPVLEDGVYEDLSSGELPPPPLKALDENDLVLYASSFSKVLLPGMRIGYLLAGGRLQARLARVKAAADICTPALNQRAVHLALVTGQLAEHLAHVRTACSVRQAAMLDALAEHLPQARWTEPTGGLYIWVQLPADGPTAVELYLEAIRQGTAFAMGPLFYTNGQGAHHLRLNMAAHAPDIIQEGIARLGKAWEVLAVGYQHPNTARSLPFV